MEAIDSPNHSINILEVIILISQVPTVLESIDRCFKNFIFGNESGLLLFWERTPANMEDIGCNLMLSDQIYVSSRDNGGLEAYRKRCLENPIRFVGSERSVGNWLAGRAAQTGIADHRTNRNVTSLQDQHSADIESMGQLVLPVYRYDLAAGNEAVGVIEFVTFVRKESYLEDFEQIHKLLKDEGLQSTYMGKTIKVKYNDDIIKFKLPLSAKYTDLDNNVTERFAELKQQKFCVEYEDTEGNRLPISSDEDLQVCMTESSLKGAKLIRMTAHTLTNLDVVSLSPPGKISTNTLNQNYSH